MVLSCCMLHPKTPSDASRKALAHGLPAEDVNSKEAAGWQFLKLLLFPTPLHFAQFHQSSIFTDLNDSYRNTIDMADSNYTSDEIQWHCYFAINTKQFDLLAILTQNQIPLGLPIEYPCPSTSSTNCTHVLQ